MMPRPIKHLSSPRARQGLPEQAYFSHSMSGCTSTHRRSCDVFWQGVLGASPSTRKAEGPFFSPVTSYGKHSHSFHSPHLFVRRTRTTLRVYGLDLMGLDEFTKNYSFKWTVRNGRDLEGEMDFLYRKTSG